MAVCPKCGTEVSDLQEHERTMRQAQDPEHLEPTPQDGTINQKETIL